MKRTITKMLLPIAVIMSANLSAAAYDFESDGICYSISSDEDLTVYVAKGEYSGAVDIPAHVDYQSKTYTVTAIGYSAFEKSTGLTSVIIPNTVTAIHKYAFSDCYDLTSASIPNSVTIIHDGAFSNCSNLKSIDLPASLTSIEGSVFNNCSTLDAINVDAGNQTYCSIEGAVYSKDTTTLVYYPSGRKSAAIPDFVTSLGDNAFYGCVNLTSVSIPNSVTTIGNFSFAFCSNLTSVDIPGSVSTIGEMAFMYCGRMTSVNIPNSVTVIGMMAFSDCTGLTSVSIPNSVTTIAESAFSGCTGLASVNIPESVTQICFSAFSYCSSLTSINIPNSVATIENSAFYNCSGLLSVNIPASVTIIGNSAFSNCDKLSTVYCHSSTPPMASIDTFGSGNVIKATLYVPIGSKKSYETQYSWGKFSNIVEMDLSGVDDIENVSPVYVSVRGGSIVVEGAGDDTIVEIFDISGKQVYRGYCKTFKGLAKGIYIVNVGRSASKISI